MKYLSTVLLLSISILTLSSASADDHTPCTQDLYNLGKCGVVDTIHGVEALGRDLKEPAHEAKIHIDAAGLVTVDLGRSVVIHLHQAGSSLAKPWGEDFKNLESEKNQDAAHAVGDVGKAIGQDGKKIGLAIWHGLKKIGGATDDAAIIVAHDESRGFKEHPNKDEDLVGFVNQVGHGTKNVIVDVGHGIYKLFTFVKGKYVAKLDLERDRDTQDQGDSKKMLEKIIADGKKVQMDTISAQSTELLSMQATDSYEPKPMEYVPTASAPSSNGPNRTLAGWFLHEVPDQVKP